MRSISIIAAAVAFWTIAAAPVAVVETAAAVAPADRMQETICRRDKETGSLVKSRKTCHTRAQWAYIDDTNQAFSRDLVDTTRTKPGGN
ncbi:hypothetical protein GCM10011529_19750 [Polymorphobacter glacialis]|uniref:Secreted protein n=1 Tax=Sandarakinorhabdus glacialis TaxID=1614636 RepID=A0A917E8E2_9SPHN|nr:hypothetical protein [Polymorphobacter glacialis]GGE13439.1 hypothetical protein GCM10011529_19750 [Polymorphobacter glacialis]